MVFISIFMILLLIGVTLWLWHLSQAQFVQQGVYLANLASLREEPSSPVIELKGLSATGKSKVLHDILGWSEGCYHQPQSNKEK